MRASHGDDAKGLVRLADYRGRRKEALPGSGLRDGSEPALAAVKLGDGRLQIWGAKIGPHSLGKNEFGVSALP